MIKTNINGLTVKELKDFLSSYSDDTVICTPFTTNENTPAFMIRDCTYHKLGAEENLQGILIR
ncbi:MAG: hypothetical protein SPH93_05755 [Clostridium sp.]|uniref:hypothetical protein n=1 Tax=Clostridium sp. TaxID=1506 RepID=UPI002A9197EC|nr:hypothetical protein [Clostridium sp.]MDY6227163.1 hypothetical protein [Clostridium sp.]